MYTAEEKSKEARREVTYRQFVYSRKVAEGSMTQKQAEKRIAIMEEISSDYDRLAEKERLTMIPLTVVLEGDHAWPDLKGRNIIHIEDQPDIAIQVAVFDQGLESGRPSIAIRIDLPGSNTSVVAETTARMYCMAARIIMAKYPDLFDGE